MIVASILWRRLDTPGHDACRLDRDALGWRIEGTAVFRQGTIPAQLSYRVTCDLGWHTQEGHVQGWIGARSLDLAITRTRAAVWTMDGAVVPDLGNCIDLDLGFTPATNLISLRRLALHEGQAVEVPAAWLDVSAGTLGLLPQRYERRTEETYWYEAPSFGYAALLQVAPTGFIRLYPGLWEEERQASPDCRIVASVR